MHIFHNPGRSGRTRRPVPTHCTNNLLRNRYLLRGCKQIRNPMSCDGDDDDGKKKIIIIIITIIQSIRTSYTRGTVRGCSSILPATTETDDPWRLDFSRVYTLIDMSVNNPPYLWCIQSTLCGLRRRIVWKRIQWQARPRLERRNIWALKVLLCVPTLCVCIYIYSNVQDGCIRRMII